MKKVIMIIAVAAILVGCKGKGTRVQISDSVDKFKVEKLFVVDRLISEFIQQLQDVYDEEGDMEIAIKIDDNDLGSEPIVVKSTVYEQLYIVNS